MRMVPILRSLIEESGNPPVIILQGDHGFRGENRVTILNAYYLPQGAGELYPAISPVNSFRVVLNEYFGGSYEMLPDRTITGDGTLAQETYPGCMP
jgi:hypothetical protein